LNLTDQETDKRENLEREGLKGEGLGIIKGEIA
jgi:hypothetical protein